MQIIVKQKLYIFSCIYFFTFKKKPQETKKPFLHYLGVFVLKVQCSLTITSHLYM